MLESTVLKSLQWHYVARTTFLGLSVVILLSMIIQSYSSSHVTLEDDIGESTVFFHATRTTVFTPFECITLSWEVERILEVYLMDTGVAGQGSSRWCVGQGTQPQLRVLLPEEVWREYPISISIQVFQLEFIYGILFGIIGLIHVPPILWFENYFRSHMRVRNILVVVWMCGLLFIWWLVNDTMLLRSFVDFVEDLKGPIKDYFHANWLE